MATLPSARTRVSNTASALAGGLDVVCVLFPCAQSADIKPRLFGSASAMYDQHGYGEGIEYADLFAKRTGKKILGVGLPIATPGTVGRVDKTGNTGSSVATITAGADGVLAEHEGAVRVKEGGGGTVGTDQIVLEYTYDGGRKWKPLRMGTATSRALPFFNVTLSLTVGTLVAGDTIITWFGSAPLSDSGDWATARAALAAKLQMFRSAVLIGDVQDSDEAAAYASQLDAYETENERFIYGRCNIADRLPLVEMSHDLVRMTVTSLTFAEVGGTGDTVTRTTGSWITDGFRVGMTVTFAGSASNNVTGVIAALSATVLTFGSTDLAAEGPVANVTCVGYDTLTFAEVGGTGDTVTRSGGSWIADGFRVGMTVTFAGSASNNVSGAIAALTATVLTFGSTDLAAEVVSMQGVTASSGQTKAAWMADQSAEYSGINSEHIDIAAGRARVVSDFCGGFLMRRPAMWFISCREYQNDLHIPTWAPELGDLDCDLNDTDGNLVEWDDRVDGEAASAARFSSLRTWANRTGTFVANSLTRADESGLDSQTHNKAVINLACTTNQLATELIVGVSLVLDSAGHASAAALSVQKQKVDGALKKALLTETQNQGPRASNATWVPSTDDDFTVPEPTLTGTLYLELNGTVHTVDTAVKLKAAA